MEAIMDKIDENRKLSLFLCHAEEDHDTVVLLRDQLRTLGFDPWFKELFPGMDWEMVIAKKMRETDAILICLSDISVQKTGYVNHEIATALKLASFHPENDIFIIPVKLTECDYPYKLEKIQYTRLYEPDGYEHLMTSLNMRAVQVGVNIKKYSGIGDLSADLLVKMVGRTNSDTAANLLHKLCKKVDEGIIEVDFLTKFNDHPYWLIRKMAIDHIIKSNSNKTIDYLYAYRKVKYFKSHELIRTYLNVRLGDETLSIEEANLAANLLKHLANVEGISETTKNKNMKLYTEIVEKFNIT